MAIPNGLRRLPCGSRYYRPAEKVFEKKRAFHKNLFYAGGMTVELEVILQFRGRSVSSADVAFIRQLVANHPRASRRQLSALLCEAWNWRQPNGQLKDMLCRSLMLRLHRQGHILLPAKRREAVNNVVARRPRTAPPSLPLERPPLAMSLPALGPIEIRQVRRTPQESLFGALLKQHHYLGYTPPVGEHLKYLIYARGQPIAALAWSASTPNVGHRNSFIGWTREQSIRNIHLIAYNTRYLILPWVRVPHLASHLLGRMARRISRDWQQLYGHPVYLLETFVDPERFAGTAYRAANWIYLGLTSGRGRNDRTHQVNRSRKAHLVYPLHRDCRQKLIAGT
jgi:hypothetical protein